MVEIYLSKLNMGKWK